ncbi:ogr/Delta-like zinc finger family protein [Cupriavidus sp. UGS-1]|nr:ogr/Delta-like zinc finger family protein [Cupriavidus sp. UGS-1]
MTLTMREITYQCRNPECGHTFVVTAEVSRTLSPSAMPNPNVLLPISEVVKARLMRQLELLPEAPQR